MLRHAFGVLGVLAAGVALAVSATLGGMALGLPFYELGKEAADIAPTIAAAISITSGLVRVWRWARTKLSATP